MRIDRLLIQKLKEYCALKIKQPDRTYRFTGIGRQALFVAVCALTGMMFAGAVHATDYFNASPTPGTMISNGSVSATPISDGNASYSVNRNSTSSVDNVVFSPVGVASTFTGVSSDGATWTGSYTPPYSYNTDATHYYAYTISNGLSNGYTVNFLTGDNAANISKAAGSVYSTTGAGGAGYTGYTISASPYTANLVFNGTNTVFGFTDIGTGAITISGGPVNFAGTVNAGTIAVNYGDVNFSSNVSSTLNFGGGQVVNLYGGSDLTGDVNFNGYNGTMRLSNNSNIYGNVDATTTGTGMLIFADNSIISGNIGATAALKQLDLNGSGVVQVVGATRANTVNINATGVGAFTGGLDTRWNYGELGSVNFNNSNGTVQIGNNASLYGNVTTNTNNNGILTFVSGTQSMTGEIGTSTHNINTLNIGAAGNVGIAGATGSASSQVTIDGNVYARNVVMNSAASSSELIMASGHNLTTNGITTAQNGLGILSLAGGTQTVTGQIGTDTMRLYQVNSGANAATSTFNDSVYAYYVHNTGTGSSTFKGDVTATHDIDVDAGTSNFEKSVSADTVIISTGTGNFNTLSGTTTVTNFNFDGAGTANLFQGLNFTNLNYNGHNATVNVSAGKNLNGTAITTTTTGTGYLNLLGGTQEVSGTVGATGFSLNRITAGVDGAISRFTNAAPIYANTLEVSGNGTVNLQGGLVGNLNFADLTENGTANFAIDKNLIGNVTTAQNGGGYLNLLGGTQEVSGTVGATGLALNRIRAGVDGATSNFTNAAPIYANTLEVSGNGTVNLQGGLVGNLNFADLTENGTANFAIDKNLIGNVTTAQNGGGYLNLLGGTQEVSGTVGAAGFSLNRIRAGVDGATSNFTNAAPIYANTLEVSGSGTANLAGGLVGNLNFADLTENGTANFAADRNLIGNVTTAQNGGGYLNLLGGTQEVSGTVGAAGFSLNRITAGVNGATSNFTSMVYTNTLNYVGNGTVVLNGQNGGNAIAGLVGTVNFANNSGTLQIGDNVNLTTGENGIQMANANNATMTFAGSSTVTGVLGGDTAGRSTLRTINAGVTGETVTFKNDVHVMEDSPTTFHVTGNGTVNFEGDLHGQLVFDTAADGVVNVSDTKSLIVTSAIPAAVNNGDNVGTINFLGSTTLSADLGQSGSMLKAVNFNSGATVDVNQNIGHNVYALTTTIGNASTTTFADVTANDLFLGNALTLAAGTTTLNTAGAVAMSDLSPVDFAHTKNADGTLTNNALVTKSTTGTGAITTNGATINFAVGTAAFVEGGANGVIDAARSSSITGGAGSTLVMNGSETVNISLLGSTRNGETHTLIGVDSGTASAAQAATLQDNSFVIDTSLSRSDTGDLLLTTSRDANTYVTKSGTAGHYSNNAAVILGTMAAAGTGYNADMQRVFNMLDIDQWGYGNNQANLATQVKLLAPIANMSLTQSALSSSGLVLSTTGERLTALRSVAQTSGKDISGDKTVKNGLWIKAVGSRGTQKQDGDYNGYTLNQYGFTGGADRRFGQNLVIGAALGSITADVKQTDFREGDASRLNNYQLMGYASYDITKALYVEAVLSGAYNRYDGHRLTAVGRAADYDFTGSQYGARLGMGYGIHLGSKAKFTPMASVNYTHVTQNAYNETGAGVLNLRVDSQTFDRIQSGLGGRLASQWSVSGITYRPEITANWFYNAGTLSKEIVSSFEGGGDSFATPTASIDRNTGNLGLAFTALYSDAISLKLGYNLDISKNYVGHTGSAFFCWAF